MVNYCILVRMTKVSRACHGNSVTLFITFTLTLCIYQNSMFSISGAERTQTEWTWTETFQTSLRDPRTPYNQRRKLWWHGWNRSRLFCQLIFMGEAWWPTIPMITMQGGIMLGTVNALMTMYSGEVFYWNSASAVQIKGPHKYVIWRRWRGVWKLPFLMMNKFVTLFL